MFEFYVDLGCSFLFHVVKLLYLSRKYSNSDNEDVRDRENHKLQNIWKRRVFIIRVTLGFLCNAAAIITLCVLHQDFYIAGNVSKGLFITIVIFTALSFINMERFACIIDFDDSDDTNDVLAFLIFWHRIYEIEYDIVFCVYCLVLSDWVMTKYTIVTIVLALIDITVSFILLVKNIYHFKPDELKWELILLIFYPLPTFYVNIILSDVVIDIYLFNLYVYISSKLNIKKYSGILLLLE